MYSKLRNLGAVGFYAQKYLRLHGVLNSHYRHCIVNKVFQNLTKKL